MPTTVDQIRSQVVEAIRAEARAQQPQAGALKESLAKLGDLLSPQVLWNHLSTSHIADGNDGLIPANLGARLSHAIFLDVLRTPAGFQLNNEVLGGCFHTLALGSVGCPGVDWLQDIDIALSSLDPITRAEHPMLSTHGAASELRAKLLGGHHAQHEDEPLTALKRVVALGASWDNGQGLVGEQLNAASVNGGGAAINVDALSKAFDFVDRLRVHWLGAQGAVDRLQAISTQIRERLLQAGGQAAARQALQRISVLQAVERIATRLAQPGIAVAPWGPADDAAVADPLGGAREQFRLPTLFELVTGSDVALLTPEFRFRLHWSLCHPGFGLEAAHAPAHRLANYPRATIQHHDERGVIARLRFMMRIALNTAPGVGIPGLPQRFAERQAHQGPGDDAALAVLCRDPGLDPNVRQLIMQLASGQRVDLAKRLISIEIDTFRANPADNPNVIAWIKEILETLPQASRSAALTAELAAEGRIRSDSTSARAAYFMRQLNRREPPRWENIVLEGPGEFQTWLEANYHREFDGVELVDLYNRVEQLIEDQEPGQRHKFEQAREAISRFAALAAGAPPQQNGFFGPVAGGAQAFRTAALNQVAPMGGVLSPKPWHALVLESLGNPQAGEALSGLAIQPAAGHPEHESLERVFRNPINEYDGLGRSRAVMVAMAARADVTRAALQAGGRLLGDPHKPSYGGVTPLMMAARHAADGNGVALESLRLYIDSLDVHSRELHDGRGWRAVHHALKAGNTRAAQMLVGSGCSLGVLRGDGVSSLIAAFGAPTDKFEETVRWVVEQLQRAVPTGAPAGALSHESVTHIVGFEYPAEPERDSRGGRTNLLAASMRRPAFQEALPWLDSLAADYPSAWNAPMVANPANAPANMVDPALEDEVCRVMLAPAEFVVGLLNTAPHFAALVQNPACAQRVCRSLLAELTAQNIDSVAAKFSALIALGNVADADHVDPLVGNMFHQLVGRLRMIQAEGGQLPAPRAVFRLVQVLLSAPDSAAALAQNFPAQDGTDPISKATRAGLHLVKFLFAQKLEGEKDDLPLAARFLADPGRYQADVDPNQQLMRDGNGMVTLHRGVGQYFDLGMLPGAPSILIEAPFEPEQCEAFLRKAKIRIQRNLNTELIPAGEDGIGGSDILAVDLSAFVKWAAHQVRTQG